MQGRIGLVIGGANGIGRAGAQAVAARGATVIIGDVDAAAGGDAVEGITKAGSQSAFVFADVLSDDSVREAIAMVEKDYGRLDFLVNSAGALSTAADAESMFEKNIDMFLLGVWRGVKHGAAAMRRAGGGSIVNVSSIAGVVGTRSLAVSGYGAAKHGVIGIARSAAVAYAKDNIRINSVCPGHFPTNMTQQNQVQGESFIKDVLRVPMGRWGRLEEMGSAIAFLASDDSSYITGQELVVDGGITANV